LSKFIYDLSLLAGVLLVGIGVGLLYGIPVALVTVGTLVIALTLIGAWLSKR
jgi:hypothetical protein